MSPHFPRPKHRRQCANARCLMVGIMAGVFVLCQGVGLSWAKYASVIIDHTSGDVLHSVNADTRNYPASLTKVMTLYLVFEALEKGKITMNTRWTASAKAARQPASKLGIRRGHRITVRDAISALIVYSANDIAVVIAENMAGSEYKFALKMTAKARALGMSRTTFRNASGLYHRAQLSTARDMIKLAQAVIDNFPRYYPLFKQTRFNWNGKTWRGHNTLLRTYAGADGLKTGYISKSGYNLLTSAIRKERRIIGVVFGGKTPTKRNRHMATLLNKGFDLIATTSRNLVTQSASVTTGKNNQYSPSEQIWGIQVGVFTKRARAHTIARNAMKQVPSFLRAGYPVVMELHRKNSKMIFRARIHRLRYDNAKKACQALKKKQFHCMVVKLPLQTKVATIH